MQDTLEALVLYPTLPHFLQLLKKTKNKNLYPNQSKEKNKQDSPGLQLHLGTGLLPYITK